MRGRQRFFISLLMLLAVGAEAAEKYAAPQARTYNGPYTGANLNHVAFPIGGIGAGMFCLEGTGAISHMSVRNRMEFYHEPCVFAAVCVKGEPNVARVLEGPIPDWKYFGAPGTGNGAAGTTYGLPRFDGATFLARFPFATIDLEDSDIPLDVTIAGWSPFIPGDADNSSLPVGALEYRFKNTSKTAKDMVFSFNAKNFLAASSRGAAILPFKNGFVLHQSGEIKPEDEGSFVVFVDDETAVADYCWFKGGWWDALTLAWRNVQEGAALNNPPQEGASPGASVFVPFSLKPGEEKTVRLMTAWYSPNTNLRIGGDQGGPAFRGAPSHGTASGQQEVSGFLGKGLVNTFDPSGDASTGTLRSVPFEVKDRYIHLLVAGGSAEGKTCVELVVDGKAVRMAVGAQTERLEWQSWDVKALKRKQAQIRIVDNETGAWGHICVDHIITSNKPLVELKAKDGNALHEKGDYTVFEDFEGTDYGFWKAESSAAAGACCPSGGQTCALADTYVPWYAGKFASADEVAAYWREHYTELRDKSALFRDTFYDSTLPPEIIEAVAANLTILKSPTVLRQTDGRLWCWEGCCDGSGCCHGSCTHVWNYAQAIANLFPDLERSLRQTEFNESQSPDGLQVFRANLPTRPGATGHAASDGQLGGIMKMYREWRISGDTEWLKSYWPKIRQSLDYCIITFDPRETGLLEESHHNTYDINYFGPDGHCGSFYLGALTAAIKMGEALGDDVSHYRTLLDKGVKRIETELYNGEYFYQKVVKDGLNNNPGKFDPASNGPGYQDVVALLNEQGPPYQYGTGCLSDGVLGFWIARVCGLDNEIVDPAKVKSNLEAVYTYNLKRDLSGHANPQRPSFAMGNDGGLLLCSWPHGGALAIPFPYSNEVWTGIEYQVASHLMLEGMVDEGLEVVRVCRDRYDGVRRNPFNEYECGHWYARAMSSYGLLQGITGARYDAVEKTLYIDSRVGDFRSFLSTATGFGTVGLKDGEPFVEVKNGTIDVQRVIVSGKKTKLQGGTRSAGS